MAGHAPFLFVSGKGEVVQRSESAGVLFALTGFACLSVGDAVVKTMAGMWPPTAIAATRYLIGAFGLSALLFARSGPTAFRPPAPALQLLRGFGVAIATTGFFAAVFVMPLAEATAITFTSPMLTALLAALLLGEPARRATWLATIAAFCGVLVVLRPNFMELGVTALLPLLSALGMSLLVIGNRAVVGRATPLAMQAFVALAALPVLLTIAFAGQVSGLPALQIGRPDWSVLARCAFVACTASLAHWLIFIGTTRAGAATVAPMTYVQLVVATGLGWLLFGERPDAVAMLGAGIIVGAGLYLWHATRGTVSRQGAEDDA